MTGGLRAELWRLREELREARLPTVAGGAGPGRDPWTSRLRRDLAAAVMPLMSLSFQGQRVVASVLLNLVASAIWAGGALGVGWVLDGDAAPAPPAQAAPAQATPAQATPAQASPAQAGPAQAGPQDAQAQQPPSPAGPTPAAQDGAAAVDEASAAPMTVEEALVTLKSLRDRELIPQEDYDQAVHQVVQGFAQQVRAG
ncbi:hypothetical protein GCM10020358_29380 [Amorphoplanes nipponensis]|uniref:hypothetical protein n=1 Tax=Actinoplanes nipponensis TaxID=135950 RepID=UPI0031E73E73